MRALPKIAFVFTLLISYISVSGQNVSIKNGRFKAGADDFYPKCMNYGIFMYHKAPDYFAIPYTHYGSNSPQEIESTNELSCHNQLQDDFNFISNQGFNSVRVGVGPVFDGQSLSTRYLLHNNTWLRHYLAINPSDPTDFGMQQVFKYYDQILQLADSAKPNPLKVIFIVGPSEKDSTVIQDFSGLYGTLFNEYLDKISKHMALTQYGNALFAYDLYNEPCWFLNKSEEKRNACQLIAGWYDILKTNDPDHLVTIGSCGSNDVFAYDPSIMKVDFLSLHVYPEYAANENKSLRSVQELAEKRLASEFLWMDQVAHVPWIIGETGFSASDSLAWQNGIHGNIQQLGDYTQFAPAAACNCGSKGFSWWQYQEVYWGNIADNNLYENYYGLLYLNNSPTLSALKQPAADNLKNFTGIRNGNCPADYSSNFDSSKVFYNRNLHPPNPTHEIRSRLVDQNGNGSRNGVIEAHVITSIVNGRDASTAWTTFADEDGYFTLIPKQFPGFGQIGNARISAPGAERRKIGWNSNGISLPSSSQGIELRQPDYNVSYTSQYINSGSSMAVLGRSSLNVKDVTVDAGGELILTSSKYIKVENEFLAKPSSRAYFFISNIASDCYDFNGYRMEKRRSLVSTESLKNMELSISFNSNTISIYPNPSSGHVWIKSNTYSETNFNIIVRDVLGMEKVEINNISLPFDLDLSNNAKGVYLINISNGNIITTHKIIIQ